MIELINVSKYYPTEFGRHYVFRNVSLRLPLDKSVGVIGPNGAGKSTFLRLLGGADNPSEGTILKTGRISPPMGLTPGLQSSLTAAENARFAGRIYGMNRSEIAQLIEYVRKTANIGKFFDMPIGTYSAGMRQRVAFAINMSMTFDYYLFDEVGAGGDREFRQTAKAMVQQRLNTSKFIIASHRTDELLDLCDSGIVIRDGTLTFYDDIQDALDAYNTDDGDEDDRATRRARRRKQQAEVPAETSPAAAAAVPAATTRTGTRRSRKSADVQTAVPPGDGSGAAAVTAGLAAADSPVAQTRQRRRRTRAAASGDSLAAAESGTLVTSLPTGAQPARRTRRKRNVQPAESQQDPVVKPPRKLQGDEAIGPVPADPAVSTDLPAVAGVTAAADTGRDGAQAISPENGRGGNRVRRRRGRKMAETVPAGTEEKVADATPRRRRRLARTTGEAMSATPQANAVDATPRRRRRLARATGEATSAIPQANAVDATPRRRRRLARASAEADSANTGPEDTSSSGSERPLVTTKPYVGT